MGCKYKAGLLLIIIVVVLWVTSAEVTQCLRHESSESRFEEEIVDESSSRELDSAAQGNFEHEHNRSLPNKECAIEIGAREEGNQSVLECEEIANTMKHDQRRTAKEVAAVGFCLASLWFATEYSTNAALSQTSVATTTLLSSTSGLFTLLISILMGEEKINVVKVVSVVVSMGGVAMATIGKTWTADKSQSSISKALGVAWTSPLVAALGVSLTIPLT